MKRELLFNKLPRSKREFIARLKSFRRQHLLWHPDSIASGERCYPDAFSAKEERFLNRLGALGNKLFADEVPESQARLPNIGMWIAVEKAGWLESIVPKLYPTKKESAKTETHALVVNGYVHSIGSEKDMRAKMESYHDKSSVLFLAVGPVSPDHVGMPW